MIIRLFMLLLPLFFTPVLLYMVSYGYINLEGGDKDVLVLFPWILWSVLFFIIGLVRWKKLADNFLLFSSSFIWSSVIMFFLWSGLFAYTSFIR